MSTKQIDLEQTVSRLAELGVKVIAEHADPFAALTGAHMLGLTLVVLTDDSGKVGGLGMAYHRDLSQPAAVQALRAAADQIEIELKAREEMVAAPQPEDPT